MQVWSQAERQSLQNPEPNVLREFLPPPVKAVEIPKKNGGVRILGVPTVADRIAQMTAELYFEPDGGTYYFPP